MLSEQGFLPLLADAEARKDVIKDIIGRHLPDQVLQAPQRVAQIRRRQFQPGVSGKSYSCPLNPLHGELKSCLLVRAHQESRGLASQRPRPPV